MTNEGTRAMSETPKITNARLREIIKEELGQNLKREGKVHREHHPSWHQGPANGEEDEGMWYCRRHGIHWPSDNWEGCPKCKEDDERVTEQVDHAGMSAVVASASKLLAAVEGFKEKASAHAINALTPGLADLEKTLENMVSNPGSYVVKPKPKPQRVSLRAVKGEAKAIMKGFRTEKKNLKEATGDEGYERVNGNRWQHLEVGNEYNYKDGSHHGKAGFVGWVDKNGEHTESEDSTEVNLKFVDIEDGEEWEAYWYDDGYVVGSSADALYVANPHYEDDADTDEVEQDYGEPGDYRRDT